MMKKIIALLVAFLPLLGFSQEKEYKANIEKAEKALQDKKLDEAKGWIDATTSTKSYMADKKGNPTRKAAEIYFIRGVIYAAIDTAKDPKFHNLATHAFDTAVVNFDKSHAIDKGKTEFYLKDPKTYISIPNSNIRSGFSAAFFNASTTAYNKNKDNKAAFENMEHAMYFVPKTDTSLIMYAGVYFGPAAGEYDKSIAYMNEYIARGGNDPAAFQQLVAVLTEKKKDEAAAIKIIRKAEAKWPANEEFPKYELNMYLADKRYKEAAKIVKEQIKKNPKESSTYFMLGQLYEKTGQADSSRMAFQKAIDIDPTNFEANMEVAQAYYAEGKKIKQQRDRLGISGPEVAQRKVLLEKQREEYKVALPYWEKLEKLKPDDEITLYTLADIYNVLVMDDQVTRIDKKIKALGLDK